MGDLSESDVVAIADAVRILDEAGFNVETIGQGSSYQNGVEFTLDVQAPTRTRFFRPTCIEAKTAVIDAPEFDMNGNPVDEDDDVATDGGESVQERRERREVLKEQLERARRQHGEVRCTKCERAGERELALVDLTGAVDAADALELWDEHVREVHEEACR